MSRVALVTVTYNSGSVWSEFYESVVAQDADWHLFVIDNASADQTVALAGAVEDPRVTLVVNEKNLGVAAANNQGIRMALELGFELVVLINNDTAFKPDMLGRLVALSQATGAGAVSPLIPYYDHPDLSWYSGGHFSGWRGMLSVHEGQGKPLPRAAEPYRTEYAPTCCVLFRAEIFEKIGMMDEAYFVYWDDVDFMWRMKKAGIELLMDPDSVLLHKVSVSTGGRLSDFSIRYGHRNQIYFARKFFGAAYALYVSAFTTCVGLARLVLAGDRLRHFRLRMAAVREGWQMSLPPQPKI